MAKRRTSAEREFWQVVFATAHHAILVKHNGKRMPPAGTAQLAADYADAALDELRRRAHR